MLKKTITYQNLDEVDVTEDFYFQITRAEVAEKAMIEGEGYMERLQSLSVERDGAQIMAHFKAILGSAVGHREGQLLVKDETIRKHFMYSGAYDVFFMELIESPDSGAAVLASMMPKDAREAAQAELIKRAAAQNTPLTVVPELPTSAPVLETVEQSTVTQADVAPIPSPAPSQTGTDDDPLWLQEKRNPTTKEMMKMGKDEIQLAFKLRESGVIS